MTATSKRIRFKYLLPIYTFVAMISVTCMTLLVNRKKARALLSRFVVDKDGNRVGESISVYKDLLIIKREGDYYAVPLKHVDASGEELRVRGVVQWKKAAEMAEEWEQRV